jgi:ribosomal protein S24E
MVVDVLHPSRANVSKTELSERLAELYKADKDRVVTFGLRTQFGGGRSSGFAVIYDSEVAQKRFEPRYRLVRVRFFSSRTWLAVYSLLATEWPCQEGGEAFSQVTEGAQKQGEEGSLPICNRWVRSTHIFTQFRGTKKLKGAEPVKKGK